MSKITKGQKKRLKPYSDPNRKPNTLFDPGFSRLKPSLDYWEEDLPDPRGEIQDIPWVVQVDELNETWMELPRYQTKTCPRGLCIAFSLIAIPLSGMLWQLIGTDYNPFVMVVMLATLVTVVFNTRTMAFPLRSTPVRFNRKRQKVYIYEYENDHDLTRISGPSTIRVVDWADVQGELVYRQGIFFSGYELSCAICKPRTFHVVERFPLRYQGEKHELHRFWSYCCYYMQGNELLYTQEIPSVTRAVKPMDNIHWPEDMERESTTAPGNEC